MELASSMVDGPRQYTPGGATGDTNGASDASDARRQDLRPTGSGVAMETTRSALSYWPLASSSSPSHQRINTPKDADSSHSAGPGPAVSEPVFRGHTMRWTQPGMTGEDVTVSSASVVDERIRTSHHNLPPIAALTSINYRASAVQKQASNRPSCVEGGLAKSAYDKAAVIDDSDREMNQQRRAEAKSVAGADGAGEVRRDQTLEAAPDPTEDVVSSTPGRQEPLQVQPDYVFPVPSAMAANSNKALASPRGPTSFYDPLSVNTGLGPGPHSAGSPSPSGRVNSVLSAGSPSPSGRVNSVLSAGSPSPSGRVNSVLSAGSPSPSGRVNSVLSAGSPSPSGRMGAVSGRPVSSPSPLGRVSTGLPGPPAGSPSPSGRMALSPHFVAPSPSASRLPNSHSTPSPTRESPAPSRHLPSPHSSIPSPSGHRVPSSPHINLSSPSAVAPGDVSGLPTNPSSRVAAALPCPPMPPSPSPSNSLLRLSNNPYVPYTNQQPSPREHITGPQPITSRPVVEAPDFSRLSREAQRPMPKLVHPGMPQGNRVHGQSPNMNTGHMAQDHSLHTGVPSVPRSGNASDTHSCQNPFELPAPKSYSHHQFPAYQTAVHQRPAEQMKSDSRYPSASQGTKEAGRPHQGTNCYPHGYSQRSATATHAMDSKNSIYSMENSQYEYPSTLQDRNNTRSEEYPANYPKPSEYQSSRGEAGAWVKPDSQDVNQSLQHKHSYESGVSMKEYINQRLAINMNNYPPSKPSPGHPTHQQNTYNRSLPMIHQGSHVEKPKTSSVSQRFPPVPQSNYDLNRQIYDRMTGVNQPVQPVQPVPHGNGRAPDKIPPARESGAEAAQQNKANMYYREYPGQAEHDKVRGHPPQAVIRHPDYGNAQPRQHPQHPPHPQPVQRPSSSSYQYPALNDSSRSQQDQYLSSRVAPRSSYQAYPQHEGLPTFEGQQQHHRGYAGGVHHGQHNQPRTPEKVLQVSPGLNQRPPVQGAPPGYDPKRLTEQTKPRTFIPPQGFAQSHQQPYQMKSKPPPTIPVAKPRRESPLDLSVKTVRQSADSTAKDDGDIQGYMQGLRNLAQPASAGHGLPDKQDYRYPGVPPPNNHRLAGAPKIDFTPNFSGFNADSQRHMGMQRPDAASLPPVESFKRFPPHKGHGGVYDQPATKYAAPEVTHRPMPSPREQYEHKYPAMEQLRPELQKRPSVDMTRSHSSQPKVPKIDTWKLAMDQHIEQRLNSARPTLHTDRHMNGLDSGRTAKSPLATAHSQMTQQFRGGHAYPQPPVQNSAAPYNPAQYLHQPQPQCQPATPQTPHTPHDSMQRHAVVQSPDPEQIIKQISKGVMPDQKLLRDKNVLSILRSSLEEKEAKLMQLQEAARRKEKQKEPSHKKHPQMYNRMYKQSLPPFGAVVERMCAPPSFLGNKLNVPRSVDTVNIDIEPTHNYLGQGREKSGIPGPETSSDDASGAPDYDGLAAFLAARIRTKAELKQVGPSLDNFRFQVPHYAARGADNFGQERERERPSATQISNISSGSSVSPPKLTREGRLIPPPPPRRRLLSHNEDDVPIHQGVSSEEPIALRRDPSGLRSSSETSVFDFRESDSEGEMPVLERQTLEEMRRDRKTFGSKLNVSVCPLDDTDETKEGSGSPQNEQVGREEVELNVEPDPFWDTACDMFVEQLQKRPPKRAIRKKKIAPRLHVNLDTRGPDISNQIDEVMEAVCKEIKRETTEDRVPPFETQSLTAKFEVKVESNAEECFEPKVEGEKQEEREFKKEELDRISKSYSLAEVRVELDKSIVDKETNRCVKSSKESDVSSNLQTKDEIPNVRKDGEKVKGRDSSKREADSSLNELKQKSGPHVKSKTTKPDLKSVRIVRKGSKPPTPTKTDAAVAEDEEDDSDMDVFQLKSDSDSTPVEEDDAFGSSSLESESTDYDSEDSSSSDFGSDEESENERATRRRIRVQTRMQTRSSRQKPKAAPAMNLRSNRTASPKTPSKSAKMQPKRKRDVAISPKNKKKKKKMVYGDGSDFRPGWEQEVYKFKQQLRMPAKLINISKPAKRASASLPDLDTSFQESLDSADICFKRKTRRLLESEDSEAETQRAKKKSSEDASSQDSDSALTNLIPKQRNGKKTQTNSILNLLVHKYSKAETKKLKNLTEKRGPRILPKATDKPEILPTPSVGKENIVKDKKRLKGSEAHTDNAYQGQFPRKNNLKDAFTVLKSRTRTQTKDLKKRATMREVFGDDRPASAPPLRYRDDTASDGEQGDIDKAQERGKRRQPTKTLKKGLGMVTRGKGKMRHSGRPGLRSAALLRSSKAVMISKRHLNAGRNRNIDLLRMRAKKLSELHQGSDSPIHLSLPITTKRLKLRSVRRKFRSGFDYIRKKKKMKKDGDSMDGSVKEKKVPMRPSSENVEDIQAEMKSWVINKGLGETMLHRAARLGYTDVAAYCLEKLGSSPSPRDNAGYTPLHEACSRGHLDIAKLLLMYGASVSESARGGIRPLHEAAENGFTEIIRLLLSFGADPLLETYTGHTALSLVTDDEARRLMQHHLADVQGNVAPSWTFQGPGSLFDPEETGYDPLGAPPSPTTSHSDWELEASDTPLPPLFRLLGEPDGDRWILLRDLSSCVKMKLPKEGLYTREMKLIDFTEHARCLSLLGMGQRPITKANKVTLVKYDEKTRTLLGVERTLLNA